MKEEKQLTKSVTGQMKRQINEDKRKQTIDKTEKELSPRTIEKSTSAIVLVSLRSIIPLSTINQTT